MRQKVWLSTIKNKIIIWMKNEKKNDKYKERISRRIKFIYILLYSFCNNL